MKFGVHRLTWGKLFDPNNLGQFFQQARQTGAATVEFRPPDPALKKDKAQTAEIRRMAESEGLELLFCFGYPPGLDMLSPDPFSRQYAIEHLKRAIEAVADLGGTEIGGVLYSRWPTDYTHDLITAAIKRERTQRSIECLRQVMPTAESFNIKVNVEILNRYEHYIMNTVGEGLEFVRQVGSAHCGLVIDVYHLNIEEDDLTAAIRLASGHIGQFHVSEPNRRIPFHNKRINWPEIGVALKEAGYDGTVTMEALMALDDDASYNLRQWRDHMDDVSLEARIEAMRQGIIFLKKQFNDE